MAHLTPSKSSFERSTPIVPFSLPHSAALFCATPTGFCALLAVFVLMLVTLSGARVAYRRA